MALRRCNHRGAIQAALLLPDINRPWVFRPLATHSGADPKPEYQGMQT